MKKNILVVSGHTDLNDSVANKKILAELEKSLPGATFDYLDRLYGKDYQIDIAAEQEKLVASFTTGAPEEVYHEDEARGYEIEAFLPPLKASCALCHMDFAGYIYTGGVSYTSRTDPAALAAIEDKAATHAKRLTDFLETL